MQIVTQEYNFLYFRCLRIIINGSRYQTSFKNQGMYMSKNILTKEDISKRFSDMFSEEPKVNHKVGESIEETRKQVLKRTNKNYINLSEVPLFSSTNEGE